MNIFKLILFRQFPKRSLDFILASIGLIILSPLLILLIVLLGIANRGDIFFFQTRTGRNGKLFKLIKFKTMTNELDENGKLLPDENRLSKTGKCIRENSLDELPQLINIITGDMSIVGPRPLLPKYLALYNPRQMRRHEVRPGITGWAQVNGRNNISWQKKFELDVWYIDHLTFWLDLKIIFLTFKKVMVREGISKEGNATTEAFNGNN